MKHSNSVLYIRSAAFSSVLLAVVSFPVVAGDKAAPTSLSTGASLLGGALPGGAVISARSVSVAPVAGGQSVSAPIASDGTFKLLGLKPGQYRLAIASTTVPKQTQGATFGEKVNAGLATSGSAAAGASASGHDTPKNAVDNVRSVDSSSAVPTAQVAKQSINGGMPNRISMNVTVVRQTRSAEVDGASVEVDVGADGTLSGRVAAQ
jgi:hypothetical protein